MQERSINTIIIFSSLLLVISIVGLISNINDIRTITGYATEESATSQVVVQKYFSIAKSSNLSFINFGGIDVYINDINATGNYVNTTNASLYYITVSSDSNTKVDFCIRGTAMNTTNGDVIGLGNYTWTRSNLSNMSNYNDPPSALLSNLLTLNYTASQTNVGIGNNTFFRFFLDIPLGQTPGTYENTLFFKGVSSAGAGC